MLESEKRQSLLEHQKLIQTSLDGFWVVRTKDALILDANEAFCNMVGYSREELLTMRVSDLEADESPAETATHIKKIMEVGYDRFETRHRHKLGRLVDLEVSVSHLKLDGGTNYVFARDITARKRTEDALYFIAQRGWMDSGENFFDALAQYLSETLGVDYVVIDRLDKEPGVAETIALYAKGAIVPNMHYDLKGTPCECVIGRKFCFYPQGVQKLFPDDSFLVKAEVESYAGIPLWDAAGLPIGLIAVMDSKPLADEESISRLLQLVAVRAAAELERERSDRILREREHKFRSLTKNMPDNIVRYNREGVTVYVNPVLERTLGDRAVAMIGTNPREYHPDGSYEDYAQLLDAVLASGEAGELEKTLHGPDGQTSVHQIRMVPERDEHGEIIGALAIGRDITERKQMEESLAAREHEFRSMAESSPDFIVRYDHEGRHLYLNARLLKILGLTCAEEVIGKRACEVWADGRFAEIEQAAARAVASGSQVDIEFVQPTESGAFRYHQIFIVPERDVSGQIVGSIAFGREITAIRKAERKLKHFIDNLPGMAYTFRLSPDGHACFPFISPSVEKFYGLKPEDMQDDMAPLHSFWHADDRTHIEAAAAESARTMTPFRIEARVCCPGQPERWLEVRALPECEADGSIIWYGLMLDITERKRTEEQLRLKEFALDQAHEAAYLLDERGVGFLYVNEAACRSLGYSREELLSLTLADIDPYLSAEDARISDKFITAGGTYSLESRHRRRDGSSFPMEVNVSVFEYQGRMLGLALVRDITERKQAEQALRASEEKFRSLAENMPDILIRYDRDGHRTYVNPVMGKIFSVTGKETIGLTQQEANPLSLPEKYHSALKHTLATGERSEFEMEVSVPLGAVHTGFICIAAERDANGEIFGAITIGRDITKLKQAEHQLRELTAHLQTVREEEKARLAREIHDDLGSTLAALNLRLSHLLDVEFSEEMKKMPLFARLESMSKILESAIAATRRIITDMRPDILDNLGLFAALKWQAEQFHKHTGIVCRIACTDDHVCQDCKGCEYPLDKTLSINLFRIFQESLTNIARHSGASRVEAEYRPGNDQVFLTISDNGCGLPEGHTPASTSFGVRGMRERVGQLGGQINFDSPPGGGFSVMVRLPQPAASQLGSN